MDEILRKLDRLMQEMNVPVQKYLLPPISNTELDRFVESIWGQSLLLPQELYELYKWHAGTDTSAPLNNNIAACFFSDELCFDNFGGIIKKVNRNSIYHFKENKLFPLFSSFYGEHLALQLQSPFNLIYCSTSDMEVDNMVTMYDSVRSLFVSVIDFYENNCLRIDEYGGLTMNLDQYDTYMQIGEKNNPRSDYWRVKREFQEE